jgi:hypothetical protein
MYSNDEQDLFIALILKSRNLVKVKYPAAKFHFIYWEVDEMKRKRISNILTKNGIDIYYINDLILDFGTNPSRYWIKYPIEPHPNTAANELISDFIVKNIINE